MRFLASLIQRPNRLFYLSSTYRFTRILFQIINNSLEKCVNIIHKQGTTNCKVHGSDFGGSTIALKLKTKRYSSLHVYLVIQILPFIDWTCSAVHAREECGSSHSWVDKFTSRSSVEWHGSHQWAITWWISWYWHFAYGDAAMWLKCIQHPPKMQYLCLKNK